MSNSFAPRTVSASWPRQNVGISCGKGVTGSGALRELLIKTGKVAPLDWSAEHVIKGFASNKEAMTDETVAKALPTLAHQIRICV